MHALLLAAATTQLLDVHGRTAPQCTAEKGQPTTAELIGQHAAPTPAECSPAAAPDAGTLAAITPASLPLEIYESALRGDVNSNIEAATKAGALLAERAKAAGVEEVVFDRGGFRYHGRVAALADAAREGGLKF